MSKVEYPGKGQATQQFESYLNIENFYWHSKACLSAQWELLILLK